MQVICGPIGQEKIHDQAPDARGLEREMQRFLNWFDQDAAPDPVLKAGIAHLWFVTLHPFDDGNGRRERSGRHGYLGEGARRRKGYRLRPR